MSTTTLPSPAGAPADAGGTAVFTIVSKNYLHFARNLMESVARAHPAWRRYVVLCDTFEGQFDPAAESFQIVSIEQLGVPSLRRMAFRYTILELNTAVKPFAFQWLFEHDGAESVVYLDPDIQLYGPLDEVSRLLDGGALMVLTPHLLAPLPDDDRHPSEHDILRSGTYNLGFLALARRPDTPRFLSWWQRKLEFNCQVNFAENLFVDQRWMDLIPGLFAGVAILRDPGYNVAYWNLDHRRLAHANGAVTVNGRPLAFIHYSGFPIDRPDTLSRHQSRHALDDLPVLRELATAYAKSVTVHGQAVCSTWPYGFGTLADGVRIPDAVRICYRESSPAQAAAGDDPFSYDHLYANAPYGELEAPVITLLMLEVWRMRRDLRHAFPTLDTTQRYEFASVFVGSIAREEQIPDRWVAPVVESLSDPSGYLRRAAAAGAVLRRDPTQDGTGRLASAAAWAGVHLMPMRLVEWCMRARPEPLIKLWRMLGEDVRSRLRQRVLRWFYLRRSQTPRS